MSSHKNQLPGYPRSGRKAMSGKREETKKKKVSVNNGQLGLQPLPGVVHAIHLDQHPWVKSNERRRRKSESQCLEWSVHSMYYIRLNQKMVLVPWSFWAGHQSWPWAGVWCLYNFISSQHGEINKYLSWPITDILATNKVGYILILEIHSYTRDTFLY